MLMAKRLLYSEEEPTAVLEVLQVLLPVYLVSD